MIINLYNLFCKVLQTYTNLRCWIRLNTVLVKKSVFGNDQTDDNDVK